MARTEGDTWDLANSVGATATMVAAARAAATRGPQPTRSPSRWCGRLGWTCSTGSPPANSTSTAAIAGSDYRE